MSQCKNMRIIVAKPRGFCAGVERAIVCVERAIEQFGAPVYVLNNIVHNAHVVNELREKGAIFVQSMDDVPDGAHLLFTSTSEAALAAGQATRELPIVFTAIGDPVGEGIVESYARPGGNVTGIADLDGQLGGKRLEMFRALLPGLEKVMYPYDAAREDAGIRINGYREGARRLGLELLERPLRTREEAEALIRGLRQGDIDGFVTNNSPALNILGLLIEAGERGIPTLFSSGFLVETGGFASYGVGGYQAGRMAARLVAKIMEGADPAEIPVEVSNDIEFVVNLKAAKALGIEIPREVLYQADRIIR